MARGRAPQYPLEIRTYPESLKVDCDTIRRMRESLKKTQAETLRPTEKTAKGRLDLAPLIHAAFCSVALTVLPGCLAKRSVYNVPDIPVSSNYKNASADETSDSSLSGKEARTTENQEDAGFAEWWRFFGNSELEGLINRGLANNPDVRIATLRLAQSKVRVDQAAAGLLPSLSLPTTTARQAPGGYVGSVPVGATGREPTSYFQGSLRSEWRADIWGEQASLLESSQLQLWRAAFERDNVQRNVTAAIASSYVEFVTLNDRLRVTRETERVLSETLRATEQRLKIGDATIGDLEQQRAAIFSLRGTIPTLEQQRSDAMNTLAFMVGTVPGALKLSEQGLDSLALPSIVPGLPSSLLLRRPDVKMAEARLLAADADIDVARTRILPPLDLTTQAGYSANYLAQFFQPQQFFWAAVANLTTSIFDGGRKKGEKKYAESVYEEMVETYARTIYQAIREVESALATVHLAEKRMQSQQSAAVASKRAWDVNAKSYALGGVDRLTLLDSERAYHRYLEDYQRSQMEHYRGYISLFQALGGGVRPASTLQGNGRRPQVTNNGPTVRSPIANESAAKANQTEGLNWTADAKTPLSSVHIEPFWQIELPGLYHRTTVGAAWRDLRERYPRQMAGRIVRPRLDGKIGEDGESGQEAWYRLYIAKFNDETEAKQFCDTMLLAQERCRVISSQSDERSEEDKTPWPKPPMPGAPGAPAPASSPPEVASKAPPQLAESESMRPAKGQSLAENDAPIKTAPLVRTVYAVQLGAFSNLENAAISSTAWQSRGYDTYVAKTRGADNRDWYMVRTGAFPSQRDGATLAQTIRSKEDAPAVLVPTALDAKGNPEKIELADISRLTAAQESDLQPEPPEAPKPTSLTQAHQLTARPVLPGRKDKPMFAVQLGAFSNLQNAQMSLDFWRAKGLEPYLATITDNERHTWFAVRSGNFRMRKEASALALQLGRKDKISALVVANSKENMLPATTLIQGSAPRPPVKVAETPESPPPSAPQSVPAPKAPEPEAAREADPVAASKATSAIEPEKLVALKPEKQAPPRFSVQLGAFATIENAATAYAKWLARGYEAYVCEMTDRVGKLRFAVRVGAFSRKQEGIARAHTIKKSEGISAVLVSALLDNEGKLAKIDIAPLLEAASMPREPTTKLIDDNTR